MPGPIRFEKSLESYGYHMEVDTRKSDCNRESAHWHLCHNGRRVGSINIYGSWVQYPDVDRRIREEAERLTSRHSPEIRNAYDHNRQYGSDY